MGSDITSLTFLCLKDKLFFHDSRAALGLHCCEYSWNEILEISCLWNALYLRIKLDLDVCDTNDLHGFRRQDSDRNRSLKILREFIEDLFILLPAHSTKHKMVIHLFSNLPGSSRNSYC